MKIFLQRMSLHTLAVLGTFLMSITVNAKQASVGNRNVFRNVEKPKLTVSLRLKLYLEGGTADANFGTMHNRLQVYTNAGVTTTLLPQTDPYDGSASYSDIADPEGPAGAVVDWIRVEIRTAGIPSSLLEAQSLLLKTDGNVVNTNGLPPTFTSQTIPVRIIVRHRNHMAISSNSIAAFSSDVSYDFTSKLSQALKMRRSDPDVMKEITPGSSIWCLWAGDVANDNYIDGADQTLFHTAFHNNITSRYDDSDLDMNGTVDNFDYGIMQYNFLITLFSTLP